MFVSTLSRFGRQVAALAAEQPSVLIARGLTYNRGQSTLAPQQSEAQPSLSSALITNHAATHVVFGDQSSAEFKHIWLRDNCKCPQCTCPDTKQKLLDTPLLDVGVRPASVSLDQDGFLQIQWDEKDGHISRYDPQWLHKYGQCFINKTFEGESTDHEVPRARSERVLWDKNHIEANFPEVNYLEFMETDKGLLKWLDHFHKYGVALLRNVPIEKGHINKVAERFAYVKETSYGRTFDVVNIPAAGTHLAYSGVALAYHTDMNYREKSPGMQMLHCLKANSTTDDKKDIGGRSMFVDGFRAARWMEEFEPTAFHILSSTDVRFAIKNSGRRYSTKWPVITLNSEGSVTEIHYNNRTMQPLQAPTSLVSPFYHAYKLFSKVLVDPSVGLEFNLVPGDLVAFNNRRVLHARSSYDASKMDRLLEGCYVDVDEAYSTYDSLLG